MNDPKPPGARPVPAPTAGPNSETPSNPQSAIRNPQSPDAPFPAPAALCSPRAFWSWWLGLVAFGFLVRAVFVWRLQGSPFFDFPLVDASEYHDWAQRIRDGHWGWKHVPIHGPLYPFVLAGMWALTNSFLGVYLCQAAIGAVTVGMTYALGCRCFGDRAGRIAGVLTALAGPLVAYTGIELCETLVVALDVACLCAVARAAGLGEGSRRVSGGPSVLSEPAAGGRVEGPTGEQVALSSFDSGAVLRYARCAGYSGEPRPRSGRAEEGLLPGMYAEAAATPGRFHGVWWLVAGLLSGCSAITRPNWFFVVPILALWILVPRWSGIASRGLRWAAVGLLSLGTLIPIVPVEVEHYGASGEFVFLQANGGLNLYLGNRPGASGFTDVPPGIAFDSIVREARIAGATTPAQQNAFFMKRVREFWTSEPLRASAITGLKAFMIWSAAEFDLSHDVMGACGYTGMTMEPTRVLQRQAYYSRIRPANWNELVEQEHLRLSGLPLLIDFGVLATLGLLGLSVCWDRFGGRSLLALAVAACWLSIVPGAVCTRYRLPLVPFMAVCSAVTLTRFGAKSSPRGAKRPAVWAILALLCIVEAPNFDGGIQLWEQNYCVNLGLVRAARGHVEDAVRAFVLMGDGEGFYQAGLTLNKCDQPVKASTFLTIAVSEYPWFVDAQGELGNAKKALGDFPGAEKAYRAALAEEPGNVRIRSNLGLMLVEQGRSGEGIGELEHAVGLDRKAFEASKNLARAYAEAKRYPEAVAEGRRAIALKGDDAGVHLNLAITYYKMGNLAAAKPEAIRARDLGHPNAEALLRLLEK